MNTEYRQQLFKKIRELRHELKHRQDRLNYNIFAGTCHKSLTVQRNIIFDLELQIQHLEYKYQHGL